MWRHVVVGLTILAMTLLAGYRVIGAGENSVIRLERFDAKQVDVCAERRRRRAIREVVDFDFGSEDRHGYERIIPNDFGVPTDVEATSPRTPPPTSTSCACRSPATSAIRIGDPDETVTGQHRYVLDYILPDAMISTGRLDLDVIGTDETLETERFEVVVTGMALDDPMCNVGSSSARAAAASWPRTATSTAP